MEEWKLCPMYFKAMIIVLVSIICSRVVESMEILPECENWQVPKCNVFFGLPHLPENMPNSSGLLEKGTTLH